MNIRSKCGLRGCFLAALFCYTSLSYAQDEEEIVESRGFSLKPTTWEIGYTFLGATVENMPLDIRNVPIHNDDRCCWGEGPIEDLEYTTDHGLYVSFMREWEHVSENDNRYRFGLGLDFLYDHDPESETLRNYTNAVGTETRGTGAALTFAAIRQVGAFPVQDDTLLDLLLNWTPRVKFEVAPFSGSFRNVWLGVSASYYSIYAHNGWDRYDKHEALESVELLSTVPVRLYMSTEFGESGTSFVFGAQYQEASLTSAGEAARASLEPVTLFMGLQTQFN